MVTSLQRRGILLTSLVTFLFFLMLPLGLGFQNHVPLQMNASNDNNIQWESVYHDSRDEFYRNPGWGTQKTGAASLGTDVTLRIRTAKNDVTGISLKLWDNVNSRDLLLPMLVGSSDETYDYWEVSVSSPTQPTDYYYAFIITDGSDTDYYNDDTVNSQFEDRRVYQTGGEGHMTDNHVSNGDYSLIFYDPGFKTPDWHKNAVGYQIFIDRFFNGNSSNDPVGDGTSGDVIWYEWDSNGDNQFTNEDEQRVYVDKHDNWDEEPTGGYDYFGGDFQGVLEKIDYLKELGIDFIWFNPFSEAPDNHGYSVDDYQVLDSYYGIVDGRENGRVLNDFNKSMSFFTKFSDTLEQNGIKIIYDAVINHASAQGLYFQRYENPDIISPAQGFDVPDYYPNIDGAYENPFQSPYIDFFDFSNYNHEYNSWFGFNHIPTVIYEGNTGALEEFVTGPDNVFDFWMKYGVDGFRLDVNGIYADGQNSRLVNKEIRNTVKSTNPNAVIIGEIWERASLWLTGNMNDGTQNMPFRFNTIDWLRRNYDDDLYTNLMHTIQENYPREAFYSLWVNLGNHDRTRVLTALDDNTELLMVASTLQFGYPGVPVVWYGDEVGVKGEGDPGTRQTYPWGDENTDLLNHYKKIIHIKKSFPVMRDGEFEVLNDSQSGIITFYRELSSDKYQHALIIGNRDNQAKRVSIDVSKTSLQEDEVVVDLLHENSTYAVEDGKISIDIPQYGRMILMSNIKDKLDVTDDTPTDSSKQRSPGYLTIEIIAVITLVKLIKSEKRKIIDMNFKN